MNKLLNELMINMEIRKARKFGYQLFKIKHSYNKMSELTKYVMVTKCLICNKIHTDIVEPRVSKYGVTLGISSLCEKCSNKK